jgi:hypothetical protein
VLPCLCHQCHDLIERIAQRVNLSSWKTSRTTRRASTVPPSTTDQFRIFRHLLGGERRLPIRTPRTTLGRLRGVDLAHRIRTLSMVAGRLRGTWARERQTLTTRTEGGRRRGASIGRRIRTSLPRAVRRLRALRIWSSRLAIGKMSVGVLVLVLVLVVPTMGGILAVLVVLAMDGCRTLRRRGWLVLQRPLRRRLLAGHRALRRKRRLSIRCIKEMRSCLRLRLRITLWARMVPLGRRAKVWVLHGPALRPRPLCLCRTDVAELWLQDPVCANRKPAVKFEGTRNAEQAWFQKGELEGKTGYVQSTLQTAMGITATVILDDPPPNMQTTVYPPIKYLVPVEPKLGELALVLDGPYKGQLGIVHTSESGHCVLKKPDRSSVIDAMIEQLVKVQPEKNANEGGA